MEQPCRAGRGQPVCRNGSRPACFCHSACGDARVESPRRILERMMFRLAHVSDVHLGPLPDVTYRDLASKRMVGYVNWQRNRRHIMQDGALGTIVADIKA